MSSDRYLIAAGLSDEATAHLRLLLRRPRPSLHHRWHWGDEINADLVVVDADSPLGRLARDRAASTGRRCVVVGNALDLRANELRLPAPFQAETLSRVLNQAARRGGVAGALPSQRKDSFDEVASAFGELANAQADARGVSADIPGLDEVLRGQRDTQLFDPWQIVKPAERGSDATEPERAASFDYRTERGSSSLPASALATLPEAALARKRAAAPRPGLLARLLRRLRNP
jgi:hypothetical protein